MSYTKRVSDVKRMRVFTFQMKTQPYGFTRDL